MGKHLTHFNPLSLFIESDISQAAFSGFRDSQLDGLNPLQREMVIGVDEYLRVNAEDKPYYVVHGGGGTGKSFSIKRAIEHIDPKIIIAAAPSHAAKNVLQAFLGPNYRVVTIAALLGMLLTYNDEGEEILIPNPKTLRPLIALHRVIVLDEISMIPDETADKILKYVDEGKKLIALGDYCQLPPVGQSTDCKFFKNISATLTQSMRFKGDIFRLSSAVRDEINKLRNDEPATLWVINKVSDRKSSLDEHGSGYVFIKNSRVMLKLAISKFKQDKDASYIRMIAYRNKTIELLNNIVRKALFGDKPKMYEDGEIIISSGSYIVQEQPLIHNGEIFKVLATEKVIGPYNLPCLILTLDKDVAPVYVVDVDGVDKYNTIVSRLKKVAVGHAKAWGKLKNFEDSFAKFNYAYAISTHKVQGATIAHTFVFEDDILSVKPTTMKEKLQSLYVSITRASFRLYILNKEFKVDNSTITKDLMLKDVF